MNERTVAGLAESIYTEVYGDIDNRQFHANRANEITDWLTDGEPLEGDETIEALVRQWRQEHTGDGDIIQSLGASNWIQVELEYGARSLHEIKASINTMFPNEEGNDELAASIYSMM